MLRLKNTEKKTFPTYDGNTRGSSYGVCNPASRGHNITGCAHITLPGEKIAQERLIYQNGISDKMQNLKKI